jgi:hypothetical protein
MPKLAILPNPQLPRERDAVAKPLLQRMLEAMEQLVRNAPLEVLQRASAAPTGFGSAASLLSHLPEASIKLAAADPEAAAVARAAAVKRSLLESVATYSTQEAADVLGITAEAVRKRRIASKLLAVPYAEDWRFPAWQFASAESDSRSTLTGLERVLAAMPVQNPWVRLELLIAPTDREGSRSVVELLKAGAVDEAVEIVGHYGEHGA